MSRLRRAFRSSSHATGIETNGDDLFARSEYGATVVLKSEFWLQSMKTFPLRNAFDISEITNSG